MRLIKEEEAKEKYCPIKYQQGFSIWMCNPDDCMAWEPDLDWPETKRGRCLLMEAKK